MASDSKPSGNITNSSQLILGTMSDIERRIAEVEQQVQKIDSDLKQTLTALDTAKNVLTDVRHVIQQAHAGAASRFEEMASSLAAEDDMREAVTSSFSEMFQVISKVFGTARRLGIVAPGEIPLAAERTPVMPTLAPTSSIEETSALLGPSAIPTLRDQAPGDDVPQSAVLEQSSDFVDFSSLDELTQLGDSVPGDEPGLPQIPELEKLPAELDAPTAVTPISESESNDTAEDDGEDTDGDPDAVAALIESLAIPISTELPTATIEVDEAAADLEKLLDQEGMK